MRLYERALRLSPADVDVLCNLTDCLNDLALFERGEEVGRLTAGAGAGAGAGVRASARARARASARARARARVGVGLRLGLGLGLG